MWDFSFKDIMNNIKRHFNCATGNHRWSCNANEGIAPSQKQIDDGVGGFKDYATMYCRECGVVSHLNQNL